MSIFNCQTFDGDKDHAESFLARFILHCKVHDVKDEKKAALLLTSVASNVFERMQQDSSPKLLTDLSFEEVQQLLLKLYKPTQNFRTNRFVFHRTTQQQGQTVKEYIEQIKKIANSCKFGNYLGEALTDQIIFGINDNNLRKRLLSIDELDLDKAISVAIQHESTEKDSYVFSRKQSECGQPSGDYSPVNEGPKMVSS